MEEEVGVGVVGVMVKWTQGWVWAKRTLTGKSKICGGE